MTMKKRNTEGTVDNSQDDDTAEPGEGQLATIAVYEGIEIPTEWLVRDIAKRGVEVGRSVCLRSLPKSNDDEAWFVSRPVREWSTVLGRLRLQLRHTGRDRGRGVRVLEPLTELLGGLEGRMRSADREQRLALGWDLIRASSALLSEPSEARARTTHLECFIARRRGHRGEYEQLLQILYNEGTCHFEGAGGVQSSVGRQVVEAERGDLDGPVGVGLGASYLARYYYEQACDLQFTRPSDDAPPILGEQEINLIHTRLIHAVSHALKLRRAIAHYPVHLVFGAWRNLLLLGLINDRVDFVEQAWSGLREHAPRALRLHLVGDVDLLWAMACFGQALPSKLQRNIREYLERHSYQAEPSLLAEADGALAQALAGLRRRGGGAAIGRPERVRDQAPGVHMV